jgi:hypothetical protein
MIKMKTKPVTKDTEASSRIFTKHYGNTRKMARINWIVGSAILFICGVLHVQGIFYTEDLHPEDPALIGQLKASAIQMDKDGIIWELWIGFHALFGASLIFIGAIILFLSIRHFSFLFRQYFILTLTIVTTSFFVWIGYKYLITAFVISMSVPLILFITGYILMIQKHTKGV